MARKSTAPHTVDYESTAADRITFERTRAGMSPAGLASRMTAAGCPMTQSGIWKIENGEPRRRITLDEAVTFARIFKIEVSDLLVPAAVVANREALTAWHDLRRLMDEAWDARDKVDAGVSRLHAATMGEAGARARASLIEQFGEGARTLLADLDRRHRDHEERLAAFEASRRAHEERAGRDGHV